MPEGKNVIYPVKVSMDDPGELAVELVRIAELYYTRQQKLWKDDYQDFAERFPVITAIFTSAMITNNLQNFTTVPLKTLFVQVKHKPK